MLVVTVDGEVETVEEGAVDTDVPLLGLLVRGVGGGQSAFLPSAVAVVVGAEVVATAAVEHLLPVAFFGNVVDGDDAPGGTCLEEVNPRDILQEVLA